MLQEQSVTGLVKVKYEGFSEEWLDLATVEHRWIAAAGEPGPLETTAFGPVHQEGQSILTCRALLPQTLVSNIDSNNDNNDDVGAIDVQLQCYGMSSYIMPKWLPIEYPMEVRFAQFLRSGLNRNSEIVV